MIKITDIDRETVIKKLKIQDKGPILLATMHSIQEI